MACLDFRSDPAKVTFAPALVAERQHDAVLFADARDGGAVRDAVGDRLVEKDMLAGFRRHLRCFEMNVVGGRVDDRLNRVVFEDVLIAYRRPAAIFG